MLDRVLEISERMVPKRKEDPVYGDHKGATVQIEIINTWRANKKRPKIY